MERALPNAWKSAPLSVRPPNRQSRSALPGIGPGQCFLLRLETMTIRPMETTMTIALKTASYGTVHIAVATMIAYLLTGDIAAAIGIGLIEPVVQTGVFAVHEMIWRR
ncbi:MAG: DUF2061 domain-containing protein, partial [Hyphomicrobiales bacterium]|nr:DUF2061 domain-containing protein [Hyphomicrobiales bacterium]